MDEHKRNHNNEQTQPDHAEQKQSAIPQNTPVNKQTGNHLANERTFLAWVRTGIAVMAFGFVIERFGILLRELNFRVSSTTEHTSYYSKWLGITVTLLGLILLIVALFNFLQVRATLIRDHYHPGILFPVILTAIATLVGALVALYLIFTT